jgi:hypothetical protein
MTPLNSSDEIPNYIVFLKTPQKLSHNLSANVDAHYCIYRTLSQTV